MVPSPSRSRCHKPSEDAIDNRSIASFVSPIARKTGALASRIVAALAWVGLAACGDAPVTSVTFQVDDVWQFAQSSSPLLVEIHGRPFLDDDADLQEAITEAMTEAATWSSTARFTTDPASAANPFFRVIMTFNGPSGLSGAEQCHGRAQGGEPLANGRISVLATFCSSDQVLANVQGRLRRSEGTVDRRFLALIQQITRDMFTNRHHP